MSTLAALLLLTWANNPALAQTVVDDEAPPEPVVLKHIPPRFSWDFALQASYTMLAQFDNAPPWMGIGFRASWGKHFSNHRIGAGLTISLEGPIAVQWGNNFEPHVTWDFVSDKGLLLGASLGPDLILNADLGATSTIQTSFNVAPFVSARIGFSQPFSLVARRFFVAVEPKLRMIDGTVPSFGGAIMIGSGMGY